MTQKKISSTSDFVFTANESPRIINLIIKLISCKHFGFYSELCTYMNFYKSENIKTCSVNVSGNGMNLYWNEEYVNKCTDEELLFTIIHNQFHILLDHSKRVIYYDKTVADIVTDMIINQIIYDEILLDNKVNRLISIPKYKDETIKNPDGSESPDVRFGKNMALFIPREYGSNTQAFETLYEWFRDEQIKFREKRSKQRDESSSSKLISSKLEDADDFLNSKEEKPVSPDDLMYEMDTINNGDTFIPEYGKFGLNDAECFSLESILEMLEQGYDLTIDNHIKDDINEAGKQTIVDNAKNALKARGYVSSSVEQILMRLVKTKTDYLKEVKRAMSNDIFGNIKRKSYTKANRRGIDGLKGNKKLKSTINVILDTSGSMGGDFEAVLSYVFQNDIQINLIQIDTEVKTVENIKNKTDLQKVVIQGLGGTELMPAINYVANPINKLHTYSTVILTDGYTDTLDFSKSKKKTLILTTAQAPQYNDPRGVVKVIFIDKSDSLRE